MQLIQLRLISTKVKYVQCESLTTNDEENLVFKRIITSVALQDYVQLYIFYSNCALDYSNLIELALSEQINQIIISAIKSNREKKRFLRKNILIIVDNFAYLFG